MIPLSMVITFLTGATYLGRRIQLSDTDHEIIQTIIDDLGEIKEDIGIIKGELRRIRK